MSLIEMIHWDWIVTALAGYILLKSVQLGFGWLAAICSHPKVYAMNRAIVREGLQDYGSLAVSTFDRLVPDAAEVAIAGESEDEKSA